MADHPMNMSITPTPDATTLDTSFYSPPVTSSTPAEKVDLKSIAEDALADSMEEISMKFSESVERHSKSLEERSVKPRTLLRIEKLEALYTLLNSHADSRLDEDVRKLLAMGQQKFSLDQLLDLVGGDPAKAEVLAQHAMHRAKAQGNGTLLNNLQQVVQSLHSEHGAEVQAGINTAEALAMFSQDPQQRQNIRSLYYRNIVGQASLAAIFDALLSQFDEHHFSQGIHTLMRAMDDDLRSQFPSLPVNQLRVLLRDLTASQQLSNILNGSRELLNKMAAKHMARQMSAARLTRRLVEFTQSNIYPREIKTLSDDAVGQSPLHHLQFLNALYPLIQQMPLAIWKDGKSRQGTLNLMLRMMTEYAHFERQQLAAQQQA
ncbi:type III secretion system gatekeeper subunit SctW [Pokkaliibacter plantistimulans]|nr:type III secretion system gatekeeper subunit SctW [Pokkaliibacter plantistimulans]